LAALEKLDISMLDVPTTATTATTITTAAATTPSPTAALSSPALTPTTATGESDSLGSDNVDAVAANVSDSGGVRDVSAVA